MDAIAQFYQRYPYPQVGGVEYDEGLVDRLLYLSHRCGDHRAPLASEAGGRILVAGCGTREAIMWALSAPGYTVDAVDLSGESLSIARDLAGRLGVADRIRFTEGRLDDGDGMEGQYDLISSFGVLHHLPDPAAGLAKLKDHLAPRGVMALMLYTHTNRRPLQEARRVIELLTPPEPDARAQGALSLCQVGASQGGRLQPVWKLGLAQHEQHHAQFADVLLNPREISYSVPEAKAFVEAAGLDFLGPVKPAAWKPLHLIPHAQHARFLELPLIEQMEITDLLCSPLLWFLAGHPGGDPRPCDDDDDLFWSRVPMATEAGAWPVSSAGVGPQPVPLPYKSQPVDGDRVALYRDPQASRVYHRIALAMIRRVDGAHTLREIAEAAAQEEGTQFELVAHTLKRYWQQMLDEQALVTPDVTRCHRCPARRAGGLACY